MHLTPLALAALAVFAEGPRHAYDVYNLMRLRREDRTVKLSTGSLYHSIARLARDGLLEDVGTDRCGNRPERTTYQVTTAGLHQLRSQVRTMLAEPVYEYPQFPVAMGEAHNLDRQDVVTLLQRRRDLLGDELAAIEESVERLRAVLLPQRWWLDVDYTMAMVKAEHDWCQQLIERLPDIDWEAAPPATPDDAELASWRLRSTPLHPAPPPPARPIPTTDASRYTPAPTTKASR